MSAVVVPPSSSTAVVPVMDLFAVSTGQNRRSRSPSCLRIRPNGGRVELAGARRLKIRSTSDVDRLAGLLLGTRPIAQQYQADSFDTSNSFDSRSSKSPLTSIGVPTMLLRLYVRRGAVGSGRMTFTFSLLAPCGPNWSTPGTIRLIMSR